MGKVMFPQPQEKGLYQHKAASVWPAVSGSVNETSEHVNMLLCSTRGDKQPSSCSKASYPTGCGFKYYFFGFVVLLLKTGQGCCTKLRCLSLITQGFLLYLGCSRQPPLRLLVTARLQAAPGRETTTSNRSN